MVDITQLSPDAPVQMTDRSGNIIPMTAAQARAEVNNPESPYTITTNEEVARGNQKKLYSTPGQVAATAAESALNMGTLGLGNALIKKGIGAISGPAAANEYEESAQARGQENPVTKTAGAVGGIVTSPVFKAAGAAAGLAGDIATPVIENTLGKGIAGSIGKSVVKMGAEGAMIGGAQEGIRQTFDDLPYSGDAILDSAKHGAIDFIKIGVPIHAALEASGFMLNQTKGFAKTYLDKLTKAPEEMSGEAASLIDRNEIPRASAEEVSNPGIKPGVKLEKLDDGTYRASTKKGTVDVPSINGKGFNVDSPDQLYKMGNEAGIKDLDLKIKTKLPNENLPEFLVNQKKIQLADTWANQNKDLFEPGDRLHLDTANETKANFRNIENPNETDIENLRQANELSLELAGKYEASELQKQMANASKSISEFLGKVDYLEDAKNVHIYNTDILPEKLTEVKQFSGQTLGGEAQGVQRQFKIATDKISKIGNDRMNDISKIILDHYPNAMSKLSDIGTSFDYISKGVKNSFDQAGQTLERSVEKAYNIASDLGVKPKLTTADIANYIDDNILPQYTDRLTGNPLGGSVDSYNAIKKISDSFRDTGFRLDKFGQRIYEPTDVKSLWQERTRIDNLAKWESTQDNAVRNMYKNLRFFVDDNIVTSMKNTGEKGQELAKGYVDAKANWRNLRDANEIVGKAAEKALNKASTSNFSVGKMALGGLMAGKPGAILGMLDMHPGDFISNYSGNIQSYFARNMNEGLTGYLNKVDSATSGFFNKAEGVIAPLARYNVLTGDKAIFKDFDRLKQEVGNREQFAKNFIDLNNTMFNLAPNSSNNMLKTVFMARDFLLSKLPVNPYEGQPWREKDWQPSPYDISKYLRYREAVEKPSVILSQIKNGYVTPEAIEVLDAVYPATKELIKQKMLEKISNAKEIPQEKRVMLFKVFGIPLDGFSSNRLFGQMQGNAALMIQQEAQQNNMGQPINTSKVGDPMASLTLGTKSLSQKD